MASGAAVGTVRRVRPGRGGRGWLADGSRPADRAARHGYEFCVIAENIAYAYNSEGYTTEELGATFVEGWKHSPGHRRNMLDPDVSQTGVAVARSEKTGYYYAVQMFGRPRSQAIEFQVSNRTEAEVAYRHALAIFKQLAIEFPADAGHR